MSVSDLSNTTWLINNVPTLPSEDTESFSLHFQSNNRDFSLLVLDSLSSPPSIQYYDDLEDPNEPINIYYEGQGWDSQNYRTIKFINGTDATNATLIAWLEANAIQYLSPEQKSSFKSLLIYPHDDYIRLNLDGVDYKISKVSFSNIHIKEIGDLIDTAYSFDGKNFIRITDENEYVLNNVNALYVSLSIDNAGAWIKVDSSGYKNSFSEIADIYNSGHWDATYFENVNLQGYYTNLDGYDVTQYLQNGCYITVYSDY